LDRKSVPWKKDLCFSRVVERKVINKNDGFTQQQQQQQQQQQHQQQQQPQQQQQQQQHQKELHLKLPISYFTKPRLEEFIRL